jgi:protoheme IX farnesyltransferase
MLVAGSPSVGLILLTCIGGYLSAGGAGAVNHYYDRDIDAQMPRTADRPVPSGRVSPRAALLFGLALGASSFVLMSLTINVLAASLSLAGFVGYVGVYTMWLKRRTPQNIVIGGAAGAFPPMVGWAAVSGDVSLASVLMFAVVFFWTPPHFWALALRLNGDYEQAGVPMMPVVYGPRRTRLEILVYTFVLVATTIALGFAAGLSWIYLATAVGLGGWFIVHAIRLWSTPEQVAPISLYKFSLLYLGLLFLAIGADVLLLA